MTETYAEKLIEVTNEYTLRPKKNDRCDVLIAAYEYLLNNFAYLKPWDFGYGGDGEYVDTEDIKNLIAELKGLKE
jgi:hypothetical protein